MSRRLVQPSITAATWPSVVIIFAAAVAGSPSRQDAASGTTGTIQVDLRDSSTWYPHLDAIEPGRLGSFVTEEAIRASLQLYRIESEIAERILASFVDYETDRRTLESRWHELLAGAEYRAWQELQHRVDPPPTILEISFPGMDDGTEKPAPLAPDHPDRRRCEELRASLDEDAGAIRAELDARNRAFIRDLDEILTAVPVGPMFSSDAFVSRVMQESLHVQAWAETHVFGDRPADFGRFVTAEETWSLVRGLIADREWNESEHRWTELAVAAALGELTATFDASIRPMAENSFFDCSDPVRRRGHGAELDIEASLERAGRAWTERQGRADRQFERARVALISIVPGCSEGLPPAIDREFRRLYVGQVAAAIGERQWGEELVTWWKARGALSVGDPVALERVLEAHQAALEVDADRFRVAALRLISECCAVDGTLLPVSVRSKEERCRLTDLLDAYRASQESRIAIVEAELPEELRQPFRAWAVRSVKQAVSRRPGCR